MDGRAVRLKSLSSYLECLDYVLILIWIKLYQFSKHKTFSSSAGPPWMTHENTFKKDIRRIGGYVERDHLIMEVMYLELNMRPWPYPYETSPGTELLIPMRPHLEPNPYETWPGTESLWDLSWKRTPIFSLWDLT